VTAVGTGTEPFTITLSVSMAFEDDDHYATDDIERYVRDGLKKFPGRIDAVTVIKSS
jgi:hypothetical protein